MTLRSANLWGDSSIFVLKIHSIVCPSQDEIDLGYGLIVSRYSPLLTSPLYQKCQTKNEEGPSDKELVLHFENFESMGHKQDAEYLSVDNIEVVQGLDTDLDEREDPVMHVSKAPEGQFAICLSFLENHFQPCTQHSWSCQANPW